MGFEVQVFSRLGRHLSLNLILATLLICILLVLLLLFTELIQRLQLVNGRHLVGSFLLIHHYLVRVIPNRDSVRNEGTLRNHEFAIALVRGRQVHDAHGVVALLGHLRHLKGDEHRAVVRTLNLHCGGLVGVRPKQRASGVVVLHYQVHPRGIAHVAALIEGRELNGCLTVLDGLNLNLNGIDLNFKVFVGAA